MGYRLRKPQTERERPHGRSLFSEECALSEASLSSEVCTQSKACGACWGRGAAVRGSTVLMSSILSSTPKE